MANEITNRVLALTRRWLHDLDSDQNAEVKSVVEAVITAEEEWHAARSYFENATEPDLVDHAIYSLEAAERKYMYLLKAAKAKGAVLDQDSFVDKLR